MYIHISRLSAALCILIAIVCHLYLSSFLNTRPPPCTSFTFRHPHIFIFIWIFTVIFCLNVRQINIKDLFVDSLCVCVCVCLCMFFPVHCCPIRCELFKPSAHIIWQIFALFLSDIENWWMRHLAMRITQC